MEGGSSSGRKVAFRGGAPACTRRLSLDTPRKRTRRAILSVPLAALVALLDRLLVAEGGFQIRGAHARIEVAYADFKSEVHTRKVAARWRVAEFKSEVHAQARALTYWRWRMAEFKSEVHLRELFAWGLKSSIFSGAGFEIGSRHLGQPRFTRRVPQLLATLVYTWDLK